MYGNTRYSESRKRNFDYGAFLLDRDALDLQPVAAEHLQYRPQDFITHSPMAFKIALRPCTR